MPLLTKGDRLPFTKIMGLSLRVEGIRYSERLDKRTTRARRVLRNKRTKTGASGSEDKGDEIAVYTPVPDNEVEEDEFAVLNRQVTSFGKLYSMLSADAFILNL